MAPPVPFASPLDPSRFISACSQLATLLVIQMTDGFEEAQLEACKGAARDSLFS